MPIDVSQHADLSATDYLLELVDLFENANVGILVTDFDGTVRRANRAQRRIVGWPDAGSSAPELSVRALLDATTWERLTATAARGHALHNEPVTIKRPDGSTADCLLDVNGEPDGGLLRIVTRPAFVASLPGPDGTDAWEWHRRWSQSDVTPLVEGLDEAGVQSLTKELDDLFELLPVPVHAMARTAEVRRTNQVHLRFLGCEDEPERFVGQNLLPIFAVEADLVAMGEAMTGQSGIVNFPTTIHRLDRSTLPMTVYSSMVVRDNDFVGTRCFVFFADASDAPDIASAADPA
ncbi:PAS domain-containing protein [Parafrankia discariae]|uniref:PAS domain-containing protein n=1 Tax=Parafrankia discariae TaxID=365528 RepID=UPI00054FB8DE|nr:PAS domain-containing protein [Parafrankia discariae]